MVHITGGSFHDIPRLPDGTGAQLESGSWPVPPIFEFLKERRVSEPTWRAHSMAGWA